MNARCYGRTPRSGPTRCQSQCNHRRRCVRRQPTRARQRHRLRRAALRLHPGGAHMVPAFRVQTIFTRSNCPTRKKEMKHSNFLDFIKTVILCIKWIYEFQFKRCGLSVPAAGAIHLYYLHVLHDCVSSAPSQASCVRKKACSLNSVAQGSKDIHQKIREEETQSSYGFYSFPL